MLETLFTPKSIAVVGASRTSGKIGHEIVAALVEGGFAGRIVPINPLAREVLGLRCFPSLADYGAEVDLAVIALPAAQTADAASQCAKAGAKAIAVVAAGFKETGPEGAELERRLLAACKESRVPLLGPNVLGIMNTHHRMNASFSRPLPAQGGISVICESGALSTAILDHAASRGIGLAGLVSIGNKADLDENDWLLALGEDPKTACIMAYLEDIKSGDEFIKAAESVASMKPVVVLKVGTTAAGARAASTHAGSPLGADTAYGAAFRRAGVVRVESFEGLFDCAVALAGQPLPQGDRVAVVTNGGGPGIMAADAVEQAGLAMAALSPATVAKLKTGLPPWAGTDNPVDVLADATPGRYTMAVDAVLADDGVDAAVVILTPQAATLPTETARAVAQRAHLAGKPVFAVFMGGDRAAPAREELSAIGLPDYPAPARAVAAIRAMCDYAAWRARPPRVVMRFPVNRRRVERIIARHSKMGQTAISEVRSKDILQAYGFNVPAGRMTETAEEALEAADRIGYPVVMKIASPDVTDKSAVGGVRLDLSTPEQVRDAFDLMMLRIQKIAPDARIEGVYVEKMCRGGREVIIGMSRDPQFGPILMFGVGGIFVEAMKDVTFHLAPITADEAMQMLKSTRSYGILKGRKDERGVDVRSIATGLQRLSQLATDFPDIAVVDLNPFLVGDVGTDPLVVDAAIMLSGARRQP
ncbi:MAG: acetate--CoA ligase family protein [Deltaproteobacteria bacterium]|nr:acetate--CoA ligase family protein [Deltaproteobacteria bacterium]